ncbi:polyamine ABC transporter ATP-binding protein [Aquibacillus halophilus]|uniref:Spermidine/putrescine import ATP-binding protein PotA n=1 Tax=Aquibacillus halophilus TaxID=930132 RepID=A0A6A8D8X6_9BACI|nr:ABC transporter ATP-binding protein [Aquibacillus halophilus]MRH41710.1 polyamine ABC transporter ATP-binding protein [Aquibacillus halophilus]
MVQLKNITKKFGKDTAVNELNLDVKVGEFLTLLGPSGCGKTTTLRMIAGFEKPTEGEVWIDEKQVAKIEPYKREVNTVFQSYSLFPHMNVFENIAFGLKMKKTGKDEVEERVRNALKLVQLEDYVNRKPKQLSGGQQQRIAIARAIVNNPKVLLLDEPLGALDLKLRKQMQLELKHLQQSLGITFIYVTHDQEEALTMSDRIVVMNEGKIEQVGLPHEIYEKPVSKFVADFIGETNIFECVVSEFKGDYAYLDIKGVTVVTPKNDTLQLDESVYMSIRPEKAKVTLTKTQDTLLSGTFKEKIYVGSITKIIIELPNGREMVVNEVEDDLIGIKSGNEVYVSWQPEDSVVFKG